MRNFNRKLKTKTKTKIENVQTNHQLMVWWVKEKYIIKIFMNLLQGFMSRLSSSTQWSPETRFYELFHCRRHQSAFWLCRGFLSFVPRISLRIHGTRIEPHIHILCWVELPYLMICTSNSNVIHNNKNYCQLKNTFWLILIFFIVKWKDHYWSLQWIWMFCILRRGIVVFDGVRRRWCVFLLIQVKCNNGRMKKNEFCWPKVCIEWIFFSPGSINLSFFESQLYFQEWIAYSWT